MRTLSEYYFAHDELFLIPVEHLSPRGMSEPFRELLRVRSTVTPEWIDLFDESYAAYWERVEDLSARAPRYWFPPRLQHVAIVTDPARVRPYFQPLNKSSWLLYASDFEPSLSNREFAAYQFLHAERMGLLQEVTQTVIRNLGYWLVRRDDEIELFCDACGRTRRPDAAAFRALAGAMRWIPRLCHESLKPPVIALADGYAAIPHTGLLAPRPLQPSLDALVRDWTVVARGVMDEFHARHARRGRDRAGELCTWLRDERPRVLVTGAGGNVLWDPERPGAIAAVRAALGGIGASVAASIRSDLEVITEHTRRFLASLRRPQELPPPHPGTAQTGLCYLHVERGLLAYNLREAGMERLRVPAPPYERFMLGARAVHEWGHLAAEAGWIPVAPERRADHEHLQGLLAEALDEIYRDAPPAVRAQAAGEVSRLRRGSDSPGRALARVVIERLPDYQANLLARHHLSVEECETYIRNNVYSLALEYPAKALFQRLARYAYEYQYLRLTEVADPFGYFVNSTWFADEYLRRQILTEPQLLGLLDTVGRLCGCYSVDVSKFASPAV